MARDGDIVYIGDDIVTITAERAAAQEPHTMSKETLGELEELVLLAILRLGDEAYGLSIVDELDRTADRSVGRASVYVLLRRLEQGGLLESRRESAEEARGRPRRFVRVTPEGLALLRHSRRAMLRMWDGIEGVLEEA